MANRPDLLDLCLKAFPGCRASILKEIDNGRSSARVAVADIVTETRHGGTSDSANLNGQFILKVQPIATWPGEQPESARHEQAVGKAPAFAEAHIPRLRFSAVLEDVAVLLYDIAGHSLASFISADAVDVGSLIRYCELLSTSLLCEWNAGYAVTNEGSAIATLAEWLGYRLRAEDAPELHAFVTRHTGGKPMFPLGGRLLVNPLRMASDPRVRIPSAAVSVKGLIHGDLHPGNVLVDRTGRQRDSYWLIDFALSREAPLGLDQAYFELALLLGHLDGADPQRLLTLLEALEADAETVDARRVSSSDLGIADCARALRRPVGSWQVEHEPTRKDSVEAQQLLARVAAGLNWCNKPLPEANRKLALAYAAKAATLLLSQFAPELLDELSDATNAEADPPAFASPDWNDVWAQLEGFDATRAKYVLVTGHMSQEAATRSLGLVPWSAIVDFDPQSNETGLHSTIGSTLARLRSVSQFGRHTIPVDVDRGTAWLMVNGWPSRFEPQPSSFRKWRADYGDTLRKTFSELRKASAPLPVKTLVIAADGLSGEYLRSAIAMIDEALEDLSDITVVGDASVSSEPGVRATYAIGGKEFVSALHQMLGGDVQIDEPTVPSASGTASISLVQLRNLNEDIEILHSRILSETAVEGVTDSFWRGNPPTWIDLHSEADVRREVGPRLLQRVRELLEARGNYTLELKHGPGGGGTTAALRCAWDLRREFPVCILRRHSRTTADRVDQLFRLAQKSVLLVAEASDLTVPQREELHREISRRNVRCVILYVVRAIGERGAQEREGFAIADPMSDYEAGLFQTAFAARTTSTRRHHLLAELATTAALRSYRTPFLFGLVTYEEKFERLDSFVASYRRDVPSAIAGILRFVALVTRFSQTGISTPLIKRLLGLEASSAISLPEALGEAGARLAIERNQSVRLLHPLVAEELLRQELGGADQWKHGLRDVSLSFIADVSAQLGADTEESLRLYASLFVKRDFWTQKIRLRRNFSELILTIPSSAGQHVVLQRLTEICPDEPHFWNHLGRHHIYEMKQDFAAAEAYLQKAIELDGSDQVHHHALGMVRRFWVRSLIAEQLRLETKPSPEELLSRVSELYDGAADEFAVARKLAPEDDHGYITHIQLTIEVLEGLIRVSSEDDVASLTLRSDALGAWVRKAVIGAEDLLALVKQMRQKPVPSKYEITCGSRLATLHGDYDALVTSLEAMALRHDDADVRRALATAYYTRSGRSFSQMTEAERRQTRELMEDNLRSDPGNERDIRAWFQSFRRLPEFSYIDAIDRLETWSRVSGAVDAFYYLYVLHFLRWQAGAERDETAMQASLEECRKRSLGRRGLSYEWLGKAPEWCPVVHASELGERKRDQEFFDNPEPLRRIRGTIESIKGPQAGTIRLGQRSVAFFLPGTKFSESRHLNAAVDFYLGFAYDGLRAWVPEFLEERVTVGEAAAGVIAGRPQSAPTVGRAPAGGQSDSGRLGRIARWVRDEVVNASNRGESVDLLTLGGGLHLQFGVPAASTPLGVNNLEDLIKSIPGMVITKSVTGTVVALESATKAAAAARVEQPASKFGNIGAEDDGARVLRETVMQIAGEALSGAEKANRELYLADVGNALAKALGSPPVHRRLGFGKLSDLIRTLDGIQLDDASGKVSRRR